MTASSDKLVEILTSDQMDGVIKQTKKNEYKIKRRNLDEHRWINPQSTFGKLFTKNKQAEHMIIWLASNVGDYRIKKQLGLKGKIFAYAEARLKTRDKPLVFMRVLVPHPKYVEMVLYGLIKDFNELTPNDATVVFKQDIEIGGTKGVLFKQKNGHCSLVIDQTRHSKIQLYQKECPKLNDMVKVAKMLDFQRFSRKLGREPQHLIDRRGKLFYGDQERAAKDLPPDTEPKIEDIEKLPDFLFE
jgi:hypothetical protein